MQNEIWLDPKDVPNHLKGSYRGKRFRACICDTVTIYAQDGIWGGGSRDTKRAIRLDTGESIPLSNNMSAPWDSSRQDRVINLVPNMAVVEHTIFQGKDLGLTFYLLPESAARLLPAPVEGLSDLEKTVLEATCAYKSNYNGQSRYDMAMRDARYGYNKKLVPMTPDQWEATKQTLIGKGLLNKAGAVTVAGRNAR